MPRRLAQWQNRRARRLSRRDKQVKQSIYTDPDDWRTIPSWGMDSRNRLLDRWAAHFHIPGGVLRLIHGYAQPTEMDALPVLDEKWLKELDTAHVEMRRFSVYSAERRVMQERLCKLLLPLGRFAMRADERLFRLYTQSSALRTALAKQTIDILKTGLWWLNCGGQIKASRLVASLACCDPVVTLSLSYDDVSDLGIRDAFRHAEMVRIFWELAVKILTAQGLHRAARNGSSQSEASVM